ncbi:MAG TPA: TVP38/TMEM64 family protein [Azospirillum sp.]|nr:TVP38/TMEM64 family protein [Azospirillum sp.]
MQDWSWEAILDATAMTTSVERIEEVIVSWGAGAPVASVILMVIHSFVPFPAEMLAVANGMLFGLAMGTAVTWTGAMLGALSAFALARWLGQGAVRHLVGEHKWRRIEAWTARGGAGGLLLARLIPVISFNLINYAAGLAGVGWWTFTWTTAIGILPITVTSVLVGSHMLQVPWQVLGLLALLGVGVLALRWWRGRPQASSER